MLIFPPIFEIHRGIIVFVSRLQDANDVFSFLIFFIHLETTDNAEKKIRKLMMPDYFSMLYGDTLRCDLKNNQASSVSGDTIR